MTVYRDTFELSCRGDAEIHDVTSQVSSIVSASGLKDGIGLVSSPGSTVGITTVEYEPGLVSDLTALFDKLAPKGAPYGHDARWGDGNGHSHVRSSLLGTTFAFPVAGGAPMLGTWQQIIFIDFDNKNRRREITVTVVGD
ncbi:MAG: secondary thiamine-phosphate synthase enzyme YjbQ [Candidatus Zixiibacteriota bacterium]|jgi:secondary thiamine-phosphate synthase enzyme